MNNIETTLKGNVLTLRIDLSKDCGMSGSGKNLNIATTRGNKVVAELDDGRSVVLGVNCYTQPEA